MTSKERVLNAIAFQPADHTPFAILNGQMWMCARKGITVAQMLDLPDAGAQMLADSYREIGSDIMTAGCAAAWPMMTAMGGSADMNRIAAEIVKRPLSESANIDKYDVAQVIADMRKDHYYQRTLVQIRELRKIVGNECLIGGGFFGPFTIAAQMLGVEDFMVELLDDEDGYIQHMLDFAEQIVSAYLEDLIDNGLDLVTIPEPVASGDLISPAMYEEYVLPIDMKCRAHIEARCPSILIHICGHTGPLVKYLAQEHFSIFSVDSIDMVEAQKVSAGRCALFGNLNPALILASKSAEEVYTISKTLCEQMKPFGGFILAPGCDLAPNIPLENLQAMAKAAREV